MSLMARLKSMWRSHDERLLEEGLEARAAGADVLDLSLTPGRGRDIGSGGLHPRIELGYGGRPTEVPGDREAGQGLRDLRER
jgi:hypothetical protein